MRRRRTARMVSTLLAASIFATVISGPARAACKLPGNGLKPEEIEKLENVPRNLLSSFPKGGNAMETTVALLSVRGTKAISAIFSIARSGATPQKTAIGRGLRFAASTCQSQDPGLAQAIQRAVTNASVRDVTNAFNYDPVPSAPPAKPQATSPPAGDPTEPLSESFKSPETTDPFGPTADPFGPPSAWR